MSNYEKKVWINGITPVNGQNMNHIEEGIYNAHERIDELEFDKQDKLIAGEGIEISENNEISVKRAEESMKIAYAELVNLKNNASLTPNKFYRITDYVTTTNGKINNVEDLSRSAGHPFDIVVMAETENTLCETAYAVQREGDTYFLNSNLYAWQLRYCIENDINRFEWADTENGKGVIYRMIDEFGNDLPYDFKNIQFKRYKITGTTDSRQEAFVGKYYAFIGARFVTYDNSDFEWFYTCNDIEGNDLSIQNVNDHAYGSCRYVKQLKIGQYLSDEPNYRGKQALNDIVLISPSMIVDLKFGEGSTKNTFVGKEDMTYSYFEEMCRRNIICGELSHNRCDECFEENLIGTGISTDDTFHFVRTGRHFNRNIIIKMSSTIFKDRASDNVFADNVLSCNFSSIINNNDYSGLNEMQYCNIYRTYNTKFFGSGSWLANEINVLQSCEIHADNLFGCSFGFLQQVKFINSGSATLNIVNMEFDTMIGLPTTIDFALLLPYHLHGTRSFKKMCCAKINTGSSSNTNKIQYTCENIEDGEKKILGAYSDDNGTTWNALEQGGGSKKYVVLELPNSDIDENGIYYVLQDYEAPREFLPTDISNLDTTEYPPSSPGVYRNIAVVNSSDYTQLNTAWISSGQGSQGDLVIKFNIASDVTVTLNPRQSSMAFMYVDVNGVNVKIVNAGTTETYTRTFGKDETLAVRGASFSSNSFYYKLAIQPHTEGGVILKSNEVVEYIRNDNAWLKNVDRKVFMQNVSVSNWAADNTYADYGYRAEITNAKITENSVVSVIYNVTEALSGNYAPVCQTIDGAIYIYSKVNTTITIPTIKEM